MIIVCEPQCKGVSHEKVNSGFIYGLRLAYPKEKIVFFAEATHLQVIQDILIKDKVLIDNFECRPLPFYLKNIYSFWAMLKYYVLFLKLLDQVVFYKVDKVFFLSHNPVILYVIKRLKQLNKFKNINFTFVLHGELEDIANVVYKEPYAPVVKYKSVADNLKANIIKILKKPNRILPFIFRKILWPIHKISSKYSLIFKKKFRVKTMLLWRHSNQYKYIALSPHIIANVKKYLDTDYLNFQTIVMPTIFAAPQPIVENKYIKFAVFGYGDPGQMHELLLKLKEKNITKPYEIRIISMDCRGTEGFSNICCVSQGKVLTRTLMENSLPDIDMFINLYDHSRHKFGCSASIFEALSYLKPVLHLDNDGYNYFNQSEKPMGFRCDNLDEYVNKMYDLIENYQIYKKELTVFRENMLFLRERYDIKNNLSELRNSFTFSS